MMEEKKDELLADRASKGGRSRMGKLTTEQRKELGRIAAKARWSKNKPGGNALVLASGDAEVIATNTLPVAMWPGDLMIGDVEIPVYVLSDGRRIVSRTGATTILTGGKGGGNLESYLQIKVVEPYMPANLAEHMIDFAMQEVVNKSVKGMDADTFLEICGGYVRALQDGKLESEVQIAIAMRAAMFSTACSKVGLIALIDEATGYQHHRADEDLQLKLKLFLLEEIRKWERTFPIELWEQFGRLTNWKGGVHQRPKYWGKLVMELVYEYLDPDVAQWLRDNAPKPKHGQNYHQWLTSQYGLKRLVEHIWKVVGIASTCETMDELKKKMEELYGKRPGFQFALKLVAPN
jgi:hypothetical protein